MSKTPLQRISIFLSADPDSVIKCFNPNDPAPLYYRQLGHEFQAYLSSYFTFAKRNSAISYKVFCRDNDDRRMFVEPLMKAIKRHFLRKKEICEGEFRKFKRRNYSLLFVSICVVIFCQVGLPLIFAQNHRIHSVFSNAIDVFSWVVLWKPIERLIFYWNPFKKDILILDKMANARVIIVENEEELVNHHMEHSDAA